MNPGHVLAVFQAGRVAKDRFANRGFFRGYFPEKVDLPEDVPSGLLDAKQRLRGIQGLAIVRLDKGDIVRHRLVQNIVEAYGRNGKHEIRNNIEETKHK